MGFEGDRAPQKRSHAIGVWWLCAALLLGPSLLVWTVRLIALAMRCEPGPLPCRGIALGAGLQDTLDLAWFIGANAAACLAVGFVAAIAALRLRRPAMAGISVLLLPPAALVLPTLAVFTTLYSGCEINDAAVGSCSVWGAAMGMTFHRAAMAPWIIYGIVPYAFALALMIGAIGFLFFRPRPEAVDRHGFPPRFDRAVKTLDDPRA